jgi:hypothetical protein
LPLQAQFAYTNNGGAITITKYTGSDSAVIIPSTINGLPVTSIGDEAFIDCSNLDSLTIGSGVINIGQYAFSGCSNLATVTIGKGILSLQSGLFFRCSNLANITIPDSVRSIQDSVFYGCTNLSNVSIPKSVTLIWSSAFEYCTRLGSVTISESVNQIGWGAFAFCSNLTNVTISSALTQIEIPPIAFYGCGNLRSVTIPGNVASIFDTSFGGCTNLSGVYFEGNAPTLFLDPESVAFHEMVLSNNQNLIVYYLPRASGWGSTFGGRPTALWRPEVQSNDPSFGVQSNQFGFKVSWSKGINLVGGLTVVVEASTSLADPVWHSLQTNIFVSDSFFYFSDPEWTNYPARYYRVRSP